MRAREKDRQRHREREGERKREPACVPHRPLGKYVCTAERMFGVVFSQTFRELCGTSEMEEGERGWEEVGSRKLSVREAEAECCLIHNSPPWQTFIHILTPHGCAQWSSQPSTSAHLSMDSPAEINSAAGTVFFSPERSLLFNHGFNARDFTCLFS